MLALRRPIFHFLLLMVASVVPVYMTGCSSGTGTTSTSTPPAAAPAITSVSPASATAGAAAFTLNVTGSGFVSGTAVQWNGSNRVTTYSSATQVSAAIAASDLATAGTAQVIAVNPDGQKSAAATFTINAAPPVLASLSPATAIAGSGAITLTVNGTGFTSGATVAWAGSARTTTFVSSTQLTASLPATDLTTVGSFSVDVAQGGARSTNQLTFTVTPVIPTLMSLSPATAIAGSAGFNLTVNGTGFTNAASVTFNGSAKTTTFVSATQLKATIATADLAAVGNVTVDVVQGSVHAASTLSFPITVAAPVITSLAPANIVAGSPDTSLTVTGTGFTSHSAVQWNGTALTTTFTNSTSLSATIPAADLVSATTASVTVVNPVSEGGASTASTFTVSAPVSGHIVQLVSPDYLTGGASNGSGTNNSPPTLSQDGRYVAFVSVYPDLVAGDTNGNTDGFLRDTCVGVTACTPSTSRITADPDSFFLNGASRLVVLSSNARYAGLDARDSRRTDVYDTCIATSGCTPSVSHVSLMPDGTSVAPAECCSTLSPDGRYMLFAANYTPAGGGPLSTGLYVRDACAGASGCTPGTTQVALGTGATPPHQPFLSDISSGGRYVLFRTYGSDIVPGWSSSVLHLFLEDTCIGAPVGCTVSYKNIDARADGSESEGNQANDATADEQPSLSKDGRYVVFSSTDQQLVPGGIAPHTSQVYLRDTCVGVPSGCTPATTLISFSANGTVKAVRAFIGFRSVSEHGRYVAFIQEGRDSTSSSILTVLVRDTCIGALTGCVPSTSTASLDPSNVVGSAHNSFLFPSISADSHYVAFMSASGQVYLAATGY